VAAFAVAAGAVTWWLTGGSSKSSQCKRPATATVVSLSCLETLASGGAVYWAGVQLGFVTELTESRGRTYVRYLPKGVAAGSANQYLTVGTYSYPHAYPSMRRLAGRPGTVKLATPGGGIAFYDEARPTNVYLAFPGVDDQIEVYDPDAARAQALVRSGSIGAVGSEATTAAG
jgi:hypothetical protein